MWGDAKPGSKDSSTYEAPPCQKGQAAEKQMVTEFALSVLVVFPLHVHEGGLFLGRVYSYKPEFRELGCARFIPTVTCKKPADGYA